MLDCTLPTLLLATLTVDASVPAAPARGLSLEARLPEVGEVCEFEVTMGYELDVVCDALAWDPDDFEMEVEESRRATATVLEVDEDGPELVRVDYGSASSREVGPEGETELDHPLDGRTVEIERQGDGLEVSDAGGRALDEETADLVLELETDGDRLLPRLWALGRALAAEEWDGAVELDEDVARLLIGDEEGVLDSIEASLELDRKDEDGDVACTVFSVELTAEGEAEGEVEVTIDLEGELWLTTDGARLVRLEVEGPMSIEGAPDDEYSVTFIGDGTYRLQIEASWSTEE